MLVNNQNSVNSYSVSPKHKLRFGCRLMAFAKNKSTTIEDDQFQLSCLEKNNSSLENQSKVRLNKYGSNDKPFNYEDLLGLRKIGNLSGWGIASLNANNENPFILKGTLPAFQDKNFEKSVNESVNKNSDVLMAHVRAASPEYNQINISNVHPFQYKNWAFMHNGNVNGAKSAFVQDKIQNNYSKILGDKPKGTTDSESAFYYFMGKLQEKYNTTDTKQIGRENVKAVFADSIKDLIKNSKKDFKQLDGSVLGVTGEMATKPSCNFIASDGDNILAFHRGPNLSLGKVQFANGKEEYLISSEKIQPEHYDVQWLDIPQNHIVMLSKDKNGNFHPEITPLAKYSQKEVL